MIAICLVRWDYHANLSVIEIWPFNPWWLWKLTQPGKIPVQRWRKQLPPKLNGFLSTCWRVSKTKSSFWPKFGNQKSPHFNPELARVGKKLWTFDLETMKGQNLVATKLGSDNVNRSIEIPEFCKYNYDECEIKMIIWEWIVLSPLHLSKNGLELILSLTT